MNNLAKAWAFNFLFYFIDTNKGSNILVITDHEERLKIKTHFLRLNIEYYLINNKNTKNSLESIDTKFNNNYFNHIIFDTHKILPHSVFNKILEKWDNKGCVIYLDWNNDWKNSLKKMVNHLTQFVLTYLIKNKKYKFKSSLFGVPVLYQSDLENPKNLIFKGASFPASGLRMQLKKLLIKSGLFLLLPQNKIIILQKNNDNTLPIFWVLNKIKEKINFSEKISLNHLRWLLVSTTGVLIACVRLKNWGYILRFPLTKESVLRLEQQYKILKLLEDHGIDYVPRPLALNNKERNLRVFIEQKIELENNLSLGLKNKKKVILTAYGQIYPFIEKIQMEFGVRQTINENIYMNFIASKLELIRSRLVKNLIDAKQVSNINKVLKSYLYDKSAYITLSHGDLKVPNTIYDNKGNVKGIIDWDMAEEKELNIFDISSLLGNTVRLLIYPKYPLYRFMLQIDEIPKQLLKRYEQYFLNTNTSWIDPNVALFLYWIDRTHKMLKYKNDLDVVWLTKNVIPVLNRASFFFEH